MYSTAPCILHPCSNAATRLRWSYSVLWSCIEFATLARISNSETNVSHIESQRITMEQSKQESTSHRAGEKERDVRANAEGVKEGEVVLREGKHADALSSSEGRKSSERDSDDLGSSHVGRTRLSDDQKLLHRAVGHLYSKIIQPEEEGGWKEWFEKHCVEFDVAKKDKTQVGRSHKLIYSKLHKEYECMVENALCEFVKEEGIDDAQELYKRIYNAQEEMESTVNLLLAAADYKKFVNLMRRCHKKQLRSTSKKKSSHVASQVTADSSDTGQKESVSSDQDSASSQRVNLRK